MQDDRINHFLNSMSPYIALKVKILLRMAGFEFTEKGWGLNTILSIKDGEKEADFCLHNLLLEIVTIDRDEVPLRFDENLQDFDYFKAKTDSLIESKLRILFQLLAQDSMEKAIEDIERHAHQYERIRIWRLDQKPT